MVVSDFPTLEDPARGVFNVRAAQALATVVDVAVLFLRAWVPGRPRLRKSYLERMQVLTITVPQMPAAFLVGRRLDCVLNTIIYRAVAWNRVRSIIEDCNLIHSVGAVSAGVVASDWARRIRRPHIVQIVGSDLNVILPGIASLPGLSGWEKWLNAVVCNSDALKKSFSELYPHVRDIRTIPRGVNLEVFNTFGPSIGPLSKRKPVRFLFLGGLSYRNKLPSGRSVKGGEVILSAWRAAEDELAKAGAAFAMAGLGSDSKSILQWRSQLDHPENVHIIGAIPPRDVPSHIRAADAILLPSLREGLPNVCLEAAACGRAVLASRTGGVSEVVVDNETGVLLPPGEPEVWAKALVQYSTKAKTLQQMGQSGRKRVEELFDAQQYPIKMLEVYEATLASARSNRV